MTKNVTYKECTCDACGKVEKISHDFFLPKDWGHIKVDTKEFDLCDECFTKVCVCINSLRTGR
jgi:hypothetical protein